MAEKGLLCKNIRIMNRNNNLSPIPFYESLAEQDFRKWYAYGGMYKNIVTDDRLIPFFFVHTNTEATISWVKFFKCCGEEIQGAGSFNMSYDEAFDHGGSGNAFGTILQPKIGRMEASGNVTYYYTAKGAYDLGLPRGFYYIQIHFSDGSDRYSDIFYVEPTSANRGVLMKFYDGSDLEYEDGVVPYAHGYNGYYGNQVYLDTEIGMPEYTITEDGEERDGRFFPIKQLSEKKYHCKAVLPEYMCDCLRLACLSDVVNITDQYGRVYDVEHVEIEVDWLDGGALAEVEITFETDTVVKKVGKSYGTITER